MNTQFTVDYFIKKFEAIPESNIISRDQGSSGYHCAVGWCKNLEGYYGDCTPTLETSPRYSPEANALYLLFKNAGIVTVKHGGDNGWNIADVNNGDNPRYQQLTPKARILAALYDIKAKQEMKHTDITKELAVLPADETSDIILGKVNQPA